MKKYKQLDFKKRCQIYGLWKAGYNQTEIAKEIGCINRRLVGNLSVTRSLCAPNGVCWQYKTQYAQVYADERQWLCETPRFVFNKPYQSKKYRKRYGSPKRQGPIKNRRFIDTRPAIVDKKERLGDWEIDTIIGKNHKQAIVTLVERVSKKTMGFATPMEVFYSRIQNKI